jgi:hypothetical protein
MFPVETRKDTFVDALTTPFTAIAITAPTPEVIETEYDTLYTELLGAVIVVNPAV